MGNYWDKYTLKEKLYELGELSARRNRIIIDVIRELSPIHNDLLLKLASGEIVNVIEISNLSKEIENTIHDDIKCH